MGDYRPGDLIVYRKGDRLNVARVDLVRRDNLSSFPWHPSRRRFLRGRQVIERTRVEHKLPRRIAVRSIIERLRTLECEHQQRRRSADEWLKQRISSIATELEKEDA